jgi:hypothetical protein
MPGFFMGLMTFSWVTIKDFKKLRDYKNEGAILNSSSNYKALFYKMLISKIIYYLVFLVLPLVFIPLAWYWVLCWFFNHAFYQWINFKHHFSNSSCSTYLGIPYTR